LSTDLTRILLIQNDATWGGTRTAELESVYPSRFVVKQVTLLSEAVAVLDEQEFDALLFDPEVPDSDGVDSIPILGAAAPNAPIIILSAVDDEDAETKAIRCGAQDILSKSYPDGRLYGRAIRYAIQRKHTVSNLAYLSQHDQLTGLVNRALFRVVLEQALSRAKRTGRVLALLSLDLDRFKVINDTLGQSAGDLLLKTAAARLKGCVRAGDTVGRLGSDEFMVLLEGLRSSRDVVRIAQKILDIMGAPYDLSGDEVFVTPSIGASISDGDETDVDTLAKSADTAMVRAKRAGGNAFRFFTPEMQIAISNRLALERDLRRAIERGELELHYQAQVNLRTGVPIGMEALVRWRRGSELVSPGKFIPIAEETGLITLIGEWVLWEACRCNARWLVDGLGALRVSVNLSVRQLRPRTLVETVSAALSSSNLPAELLELEVTESLLMDDIAAARIALSEIKELGVKISVDDFGTGYSSMNYLKRFPIDTLKIDQSFLREVPVDPDNTAISTAIIALGHGLRMDVVAEGVETVSQLQFLRTTGCDRAQGYLISRPVPMEAFAEWVRTNRSGQSWLE